VPPFERRKEGPWEYTGYLASESLPKPVFKVTALTHRNNPIQVHSCMGVPVDDSDVVTTVIRAATFRRSSAKGFPLKWSISPKQLAIWL
jgi:4-hydroxy-3-polyprenylbenzoate decarboxylase